MEAEQPMNFELEVSRAFTPSAPIDERTLFAGRLDKVREIMDAVNQKGQHAILYGERGVGKTSLANVLSTYFSGAHVIAPKVNCAAEDTFSSLWRKVFEKIEFQSEEPVLGLIQKSEPSLFSFSSMVSDPISIDEVRKQLIRLSSAALPILIIDEFDRLATNVKRAMADCIKVLSDEAIGATVILVGVADSVGDLIEEHQSISRALVQILMPRMSKAEICQIIENGLKLTRQEIEPDALDQIALLARGLPHYAHLIGLHASREAYDENLQTINSDCIDAAVGKALQKAQETIKTLYVTATSSPRPMHLFAEVLLACAICKVDDLGYFSASDVRGPLQAITGKSYEIPSFSQHLNDFCEPKRGPVLKKIGQRRSFRFRFIDPLMQPYIVMQGRHDNKLPQHLASQQAAHS